jgi:hypothetical protein
MKRGYTQLWLILAVVLTLGTVAWVIAELAPMGIRGEWVWSFEKTANVDRVMFALVPVAVLGWLTWGMGGSLSLLRGGRLWAFLVAVIMLTVWLQGAFAYMSQNAFAEATFWMGTPKLNEDFDEATRMTSIRRLLQEVQSPELTVRVHETSHLPGPVLFYHLQWRAWRNVPSVATWFADKMESTLWYSRDARVSLEMNTLHREFFPAERATLYSSMVLLWLAVALGLVPLYYWMNDLFGQGAAITAVGLYPVIPGLLIFNPVTDQLFVPMALVLIGLFHWGLSSRKPIVLLLAGIAAWVAFQFTLLLAAILVVILIDLLIDLSFGRRDKASLMILTWPVAGFWGVYLLAWLWLGYNSFNAWAVWVTGAADYVETHHRSYGWWLLYNPLDFALFLGAPLALFAVRGILVLRENWTHQAMWRFMVAFLVTILVLNLTGVTRGEVARVWMFLMPLATALAAYGIDEASDHGLPFYPVCLGLLFLQATVFRMSITGLLSAVESVPY